MRLRVAIPIMALVTVLTLWAAPDPEIANRPTPTTYGVNP